MKIRIGLKLDRKMKRCVLPHSLGKVTSPLSGNIPADNLGFSGCLRSHCQVMKSSTSLLKLTLTTFIHYAALALSTNPR